jgi:hypothetical protein
LGIDLIGKKLIVNPPSESNGTALLKKPLLQYPTKVVLKLSKVHAPCDRLKDNSKGRVLGDDGDGLKKDNSPEKNPKITEHKEKRNPSLSVFKP